MKRLWIILATTSIAAPALAQREPAQTPYQYQPAPLSPPDRNNLNNLSIALKTPVEQPPPKTYKDEQGHIITLPRWLKIPSEDDLANYAPVPAIGGFAKLNCVVTVRGTLDDCQVAEELPAGHGFGAAAILAAPLFSMTPQLVDGVPVGGAPVTIPIRFARNDYNPSPIVTSKVMNSVAWSATPTAAEMAAAFPKRALGHATAGRVVLRCALSPEGGLKDCDPTSEQPAGRGFAGAARDLSKRFRVFADPDYVKKVSGYHVDVPFDFHDPSQPTAPLEMHNPTWLQTVDPNIPAQLFPAMAAKAGLTTGRATVTCQVAHDGSLGGCVVAKEEPEGLGFGQAALTIAAVMKMNPWTVQGAPVDDARISLPIRVNADAPAAPTAPAPH